MNIVVFIGALTSGGAEKQAVLLAKSLGSIYNVSLVVYKGNNISNQLLDYINNNNINLVRLGGNHFKRNIDFYFFLKNNKIEVIFSYLFLANFLGGFLGKISGVKYVVGGIRSSQLAKKKFYFERVLHNRINSHTIINNFSGKEKLSTKGFKRNKMEVIPNCFEVKTEPIIRDNEACIQIISVGRFVEAKDYFTALMAISELKKTGIKFKYIIVGWGRLEKKIKSWIKNLNLSEIVTVIIEPRNLNELYLQSDVFLLTSLFEGTSNVIMEAMSFSLAIVATDVGDNNMLIENEKSGFLCKPRDYLTITDKLFVLLQSKKLRNKFGLYGYNKLKSEYNEKVFSKRYLDFINTL